MSNHVLPDVLENGLLLVICGMAPGDASAAAGAYYAKPGNAFWGMLHQTGITPRRLEPREFPTVTDYGVGLTDIVKETFGRDHVLKDGDADPEGLRSKILRYGPRILAFNGKKSASLFLGTGTSALPYGKQGVGVGDTAIYVLPSTSGAACRDMKLYGYHWRELGGIIRRMRDESRN